MNFSPCRRGISILAVFVLSAFVTAEPIDLDHLPNYANQPIPPYIQKDQVTPQNPITDRGATLGRVLFYDKQLSVTNTVSCSSCHQQANAFSDPLDASVGVHGSTGRHSMRLVNIRFARERRAFWDERATSVEDQATQPIKDHKEMGYSGLNGDPGFGDLLAKMEQLDYYPFLFNAAYGDPAITEARMQSAIAQFLRSIQSFDTRYDAGRAQAPNDGAPFPNFTQSENRGKQLFLAPPQFNGQGVRVGGGAGCAGCHQPPEFDIDPNSRSNAVIGSLEGGQDLTNTRSPGLRDAFDAAGNPYGGLMHDASLASMDALIAHYNQIPAIAATADVRNSIDPRLLPAGNPANLNMTTQEKTDMAAFLRTLSGTAVRTDVRWSDPFDAQGHLVVVGLNDRAVDGLLLY